MATTPQVQPTPALFFKTLNAYQETEAVRSAIELDLFTVIDEGAHEARPIGMRIKASERGVRILCDYLTVIGFLTKTRHEYHLTPDSALFLSRKSPACLASAVGFLHTPMLTERFSRLTDAVRKGGTAQDLTGTMAPDHPIWVDFARSMAPLMTMPAQAIASAVNADAGAPCKVLDIAAGHGMFGITIGKRNPNAQIYAVDWKAVLEVAKEHAAAAGVSDRYHAMAGSAFEVELGTGYDVVLLTNFLHHFSPDTNQALLRRMHAALQPGGRAITLEFVPNEDRISPPVPATFSLMMLATTESGDAYTFPELERMCANAGFARSERQDLPGGFGTLVVSHK